MIVTKDNLEQSWLGKYWNDIQSGKTIVGYEMYLNLKNLIDDLDNDRYYYDTKDADVRIDFIENCVRLTKDPFYGKLMKLQTFQKAFIEVFYGFKFAHNGIDRFTETLYLIARKNGKSELCSALALTEMILGGSGLDIVCGSNDESQASILYEACDTMRLMIDPDEVDTWRNQKGLRCMITNNKLYKMSERQRNKEGYNISIAIIDEVHEMANNKLYKPIQQSTGVKERYKIFIITTEGFVNGGFLDELLIDYRKVLRKRETGYKAERRLPWLYTQDSEKEVWDVDDDGYSKMWMKANPGLGTIKKYDYLREQVDGARNSLMERPFVLSKDFNFKVNNSEAWLLRETYMYDIEFKLEGRYVGIGAVDLSETTDMTSAKIYLYRKDDKKKYVLSHYWIPSSKLNSSADEETGARYMEWAQQGLLTIQDGNKLDLGAVADWFFEMTQKYNIYLYKTGYDRKFKTDWVNRMEYYGWVDREDLIEIIQTPERLHDHILQVGSDLEYRVIVGLNEIDKWCLGNASKKIYPNGKILLTKMDNKPSYRIDGALSLVIAEATSDLYMSDIKNLL